MGYYYNDPSGLGSWYVQDNQTPQQAITQIQQDSGVTLSPILSYSIAHTPATTQPNGGNPAPKNTTSPPKPVSYSTQGAVLVPLRPRIDTGPSGAYTCVPPTYLTDEDTGELYPFCQDGYFYDDSSEMCCQLISPPVGGFPVGTTTSSTNPADTVTVTVNNAVSLASGVGQAIGDAVNQDVQSAIDSTNTAIENTTSTIQSTIDDVTTKVGSLVDGIINNVYKALQWVGNLLISQIGNVLNYIQNNISTIIDDVKNIYNKVTDLVTNTIEPLINSVNNVITNTIAPVFQTISQVYQQTNALITAIQQDVKNGVLGLLQLPTDISNSITSIEATIGRAVDQIGLKRQDGTSVLMDLNGKFGIYDSLQGLGTTITSATGHDQRTISFSDHITLKEPGLLAVSADVLKTAWSNIQNVVQSLLGQGQDNVNQIKQSVSGIPFFLGDITEVPVTIALIVLSIVAEMKPLADFIIADSNSKMRLGKLDSASVLEALKRNLLTLDNAQQELAFTGLDSTRIQTLIDLTTQLVDTTTALEMYFRGIVTIDDLRVTLAAHGYTKDDQDALIEVTYRTVDVQTALTARRWNLIDDTQLDAVLAQNHYTPNEITLTHATLYSHETFEQVISRERVTQLYTGLGFTDPGFGTPSTDALVAAQRDGVDAQVALDKWQTTFFVPALQEWINFYHRGFITTSQLNAAMDYYRVPAKLRDMLVPSYSALLPYRTIPTMIVNGIIDETYAKQQLAAHGFDLVAQEAILKYAALTKPKATAKPPADVLGLSLGTARGYFDQGTLTPEQYTEVLLAHGYDAQTAALTVSVETQHAAMLARKQLASDIIAEVKAGVMTMPQAEMRMENSNFSDAEKARVANAIAAQKRQAQKIPSESELHEMVSKGSLSLDMYRQTMSLIGWSDSWIQQFVNWRFPSAQQNQASA